MSPTFFNIINTIVPNENVATILTQIENVILPIIYALSGGVLVFCLVKFGFKIQNDPRNKGIYIKHLVWCVVGCVIVLIAAGIAHAVFEQLLKIKT